MQTFWTATKTWFFTTIIVIVSGDRWGLVHFTTSDNQLYECLENSVHWNFFEDTNTEWKQDVISALTPHLSRKTIPSEQVKLMVIEKVESLINTRPLQIPNNVTLFRLQARKALRKILLDCSDKTTYQSLPRFVQDSAELGRLLDLILVNWPYLRNRMLSTQVRLLTLQRFAEDGLSIMSRVSSLHAVLYELQGMWWRRALLFFDGRDKLRPYVNHVYSLDHNETYTNMDPSIFVGRRFEDFDEVRNPDLAQSYADSLLNLYPVDPGVSLPDDLGEHYGEGIDAADYYYEIHLANFFRVILAYLELIEGAGVEIVTRMLHNDTYYGEYLLEKKWKELLMVEESTKYSDNLEQSLRVSVPDLVMLTWTRLRNQDASATTTTRYRESKRGKGHFFKSQGGKCFSKSQGKCDAAGSSERKEWKDEDDFGYVLSPERSDRLLLPEEQELTFNF